MGGKSNALENRLIDFWLRGQALTPPTTTYIKLITCSGKHAVNTSVALNDLIGVQGDDNRWRLYRVTTQGTTASTKPSYPGVNGEVITDGTAVLTEQNAELESGAAITEPVGGGYANVAVTSNMTNWSGTQGAGTTVASSGTDGTVENNVAITFPDPTADWGWIFGFVIDDTNATLGNYIWAEFSGGPVQIVNGATNVSFAINGLTVQEDT